jgi:hypothetical protein
MANPHQLAIQIVRFVRKDFPGWVACEFTDAEGHRHGLVDKVPIFSAEHLDERNKYPRPGTVRCEVLARLRDNQGQEVVHITTARPDGVESSDGRSEFVVFASQLSD